MTVVLGLAAFLLDVVGAVAPARATAAPAAAPTESSSAASVRAFFAERPPVVDFQYAQRATRVLADWTVHSLRPVRATENWLIWSAGRVYPFAGNTQDPDRIVDSGHGICNDVATAMVGLLGHIDVDARIVRLGDQHIVNEVRTDQGWVFVDADWGIALPMPADELDAHRADVTAALRDAGYDGTLAETYLDFVSVDRIDRLAIGAKMGPTLWLFEQVAWAAKWPLPLLMIASGLLLRRRRTGSGAAPVALAGAAGA